MPLRNQKQVMAGIDQLAGRGVAAAAVRYRKGVIGPLVSAIEKAKSPAGLLARLGGGLMRAMDTASLEEQLAESTTQAGLIGAVSATPRKESR